MIWGTIVHNSTMTTQTYDKTKELMNDANQQKFIDYSEMYVAKLTKQIDELYVKGNQTLPFNRHAYAVKALEQSGKNNISDLDWQKAVRNMATTGTKVRVWEDKRNQVIQAKEDFLEGKCSESQLQVLYDVLNEVDPVYDNQTLMGELIEQNYQKTLANRSVKPKKSFGAHLRRKAKIAAGTAIAAVTLTALAYGVNHFMSNKNASAETYLPSVTAPVTPGVESPAIVDVVPEKTDVVEKPIEPAPTLNLEEAVRENLFDGHYDKATTHFRNLITTEKTYQVLQGKLQWGTPAFEQNLAAIVKEIKANNAISGGFLQGFVNDLNRIDMSGTGMGAPHQQLQTKYFGHVNTTEHAGVDDNQAVADFILMYFMEQIKKQPMGEQQHE